MAGIISASIGLAGTIFSSIEARKAQKKADAKADAAEREAKRIRDNIRVEEAGAKFQAGVQTNREVSSASDFLNPLSIGI